MAVSESPTAKARLACSSAATSSARPLGGEEVLAVAAGAGTRTRNGLDASRCRVSTTGGSGVEAMGNTIATLGATSVCSDGGLAISPAIGAVGSLVDTPCHPPTTAMPPRTPTPTHFHARAWAVDPPSALAFAAPSVPAAPAPTAASVRGMSLRDGFSLLPARRSRALIALTSSGDDRFTRHLPGNASARACARVACRTSPWRDAIARPPCRARPRGARRPGPRSSPRPR